MADAEFLRRPRSRPLVSGGDRPAFLLRHRQELAREREHDALLDEPELLPAIAPELADAVDARLDDVLGRRGSGGDADVPLDPLRPDVLGRLDQVGTRV